VRSLYLLTFTAGFVVLGAEISASRLLEPAFGNSQIVWAAIIGMILLYLALGAWLGGKLADRFPYRHILDVVLTVAALGVAAIPLASRPVLHMAATGMDSFAAGLLGAALLAIVLLFSVPVLLLGTTSPWVAKLALQQERDTQAIGATLGRLSALNTVGSLLGAFVPVLLLIPLIGTRMTFFTLAIVLLVVLVIGAWGKKHLWFPVIALILVSILAWWSARDNSIRSAWDDGSRGAILYEDESAFNYIAVRQWGNERHLKLNDGIGIHSVYHPDTQLSEGIWDYFLLAPLFRPLEDGEIAAPQNLLLLGMAAGTVSGLYSEVYGDIPITGVELDPEILQVGGDYFAMNRPNLTAVAADARRYLAQQDAATKWDVIAVDAYRPPYIPFHLTTREFFQLVHDHLDEDGVLAINVGRTAINYDLVDAMASTVGTLFPSVHLVDEPGPPGALGNTMLIATKQPTALADFQRSAATIGDSLGGEMAGLLATALSVAHTTESGTLSTFANRIFTDDHAPIEWLVHGIVLDYVTAAN